MFLLIDLPLQLFTVENAKKEFEKGNKASTLYILTYALILEVFRNSYLTISVRSYLAEVCLYLLLFFYTQSKSLPDEFQTEHLIPKLINNINCNY